ncbi:RpiR family transcriptional regulator [Listeria seeligeri]|uniref:RpiR family transcriptional regulator n=1 Tax=Listeria seeligeri TaxID=1640 RepID=UPI001628040D|nr:RpiR family transcriptional regulator [Listeria seeligeri]MBC1420364.1 RpiR family transcriptional regulator [Listeria seeligeri]MBC1423409.1 RpiR family transcriptional regulator [Listeria seeligeri]MBC1429478.1 RpiR family transcriptional regulator [Listeria seeligeri]MBC1526982.1 RpiR family transcriptional regulator [Listeria seeligeri]MBC1532272.1 RpiR family transcriptional regulator [Listeria seeligeri]
MKLEGTCKIYSTLGLEYQFGEFYIDRDYLVFDQNFSLGMKKRQTFPVAKLRNITITAEENELSLTFSCDNIQFEINENTHGNLREFKGLLENKGLNGADFKKEKNSEKTSYTTHHYHNFAQ